MEKTTGLIAAPYTPFNTEGALNLKVIPSYANYLKNAGVRGVFVNGTTGEGVLLTREERKQCAKAWIDMKDKDFKVLIHVGHNSLPVCQELANHAEESGADAFGLIAPNYFKPESLDMLVAFNEAVAEAAPSLPYYYYHMPKWTGIHYNMIDFLKLADGKIPNLAGIKFTHEDLMDMKLCLEYANRKFDILFGRDEILLCGLVLGTTGAIGSTYNYLAPLFVRIIEAFNNNDLEHANQLQLKAMHMIDVLVRYGGAVKAGKAFMRLAGFDFGRPRLPVASLTQAEEDRLHKELKVLDFDQYCNPA